MKQQTSMRPTMNLVVMLHTTQMNPLQTNMSKEDSSHQKQITWLHSHNNSHHLRKAAKRTPSSMDQDMTEKGVPRAILQGLQVISHKGQPLQHPQHKLEDHHRLPQSPNQTETTRIHQNAMTPMDPPKHLQMAKAKELLNQRRQEPHPRNMTNTGPATQPSDSSKNTIICSGCGKSGHWSRNCPYYNFCDFCRVTTHSTHMCRANKCGPGSPVCIYCGKTNHSSAYCRYRPRDNWEEPKHTPDALKTGATGKNLASVARNQTGPTHHNINSNPFSHIDGRGQNQHYGGPQRSQPREQTGAAPRGEQIIIIKIFLLGDSSMPTLMKGTTGDILLQHSLHQHSTIPWPVMLLVDQ